VKTKKSLRQEIKDLLSAQSVEERDKKSRAIQKKLFGTPVFQRAGTVCFFVSMPMEVNTHPMIEEALRLGKTVLVPLVDLENKELKLKQIRDFRKDLSPGTLGILEPASGTKDVPAKDVECVIVPGLVFDGDGNRLGRGGGFYDRLLAGLPAKASTIGLAFSFQVLPNIPLENHDRSVGLVLTEK
jgi:5-formyltetrahydrofolate cyclo-ligase